MIQRVYDDLNFLVRANGREYNKRFLGFLIDYWVFWVEWDSKHSKTALKFYETFMDNVTLLDWREKISNDSQYGN